MPASLSAAARGTLSAAVPLPLICLIAAWVSVPITAMPAAALPAAFSAAVPAVPASKVQRVPTIDEGGAS